MHLLSGLVIRTLMCAPLVHENTCKNFWQKKGSSPSAAKTDGAPQNTSSNLNIFSEKNKVRHQPRADAQGWAYLCRSVRKDRTKGKCPSSGQISPSKGWVSIDRSIKAALLGTTPRPKAKSSTNDFVFPRSKYGYQATGQACITDCLSLLGWLNHLSRSWVYCCLATQEHRRYRCKSGRDSDLEAFSLYPSDGSLAPLAFRPST